MELRRETLDRLGNRLVIRSMTKKDAPAVLWLMRRCMSQSMYLSRYPDEMRFTVQQEEEFICSANENPNGVLLGAFAEGEMIGICSALPVAPGDRYRHRASLGIMINKAHWGRGVGSVMLGILLEAMEETGIEQIELDVVSANAAAIALYEKYGFSRYGLHERGMKYRDGSYADLLLMKLELKRSERS